MCGIFGVIANNDNVKDQIFDGLRRLEYRGYDSSGIATINNDQINCIKSQGNLDQLQKNRQLPQRYDMHLRQFFLYYMVGN